MTNSTGSTSTKRPPRILVFDSGVGGLSILQEIQQQYPDYCFYYLSDNAAFPYGTKTEAELITRVDVVLQHVQAIIQADIIVIACNSASTVALGHIRQCFSQPVVGVVPAIKPAALISHTKVIGLLATPGTIKRSYTEQLLEEFAHDCEVIRVGSSELVTWAEKKLRNDAVDMTAIQSIVKPFMSSFAHLSSTGLPIDTMVLACTHFPLLKEELQQALPNIKHWVDSGEAIARRVGYWIDQLGLHYETPNADPVIYKSTNKTENVAYFTQASDDIAQLTGYLVALDIHSIQYVSPKEPTA